MERSLSSKENLYFDPKTGKLCTSRPANDSSRPTGDQAIAVDMNKPGSGGFFAFHLEGTRNKEQCFWHYRFPLQCTLLDY